jgi:hypothetical protein
MFLSAKLGLVLAQFMWKQQPQLLQVMPFVTPTASFTVTRKTIGHLYNIYTNTVIILLLYYSLIYFKVNPREEL